MTRIVTTRYRYKRPPRHRYLAIYEFEAEKVAPAIKTFMERSGTPTLFREIVRRAAKERP